MFLKSVSWAILALFGFGMGSITPAHAATILIVAGTDGTAQAAATVLNTDLSGSNTVTIVHTGVPASLVGYTQIYDTRYNNSPALTSGEQTQYLGFLNAASGNMLFLMGENTSFNARNTPINNFITLAGGGTIAAPGTTSSSSETLNVPFTTTPNAISTVKFAACGIVTSAGTGAFASKEAGGGGALYFSQGTLANALAGALIVVYDVNFIATAPTGAAVNEVAFRANMESVVAGGGILPGPIASIALCSSANPSSVLEQVTFTATVTASVGTPTGSVDFYDGATLLGSDTLTSGVATYATSALALGTYAITARYSGDANFCSVTSGPVSQVVAGHTILINSSETTLTIQAGGVATTQLTLSSLGTVSAPVTFSVAGLPAGAICELSTSSVDLDLGPATVTATITTTSGVHIHGQVKDPGLPFGRWGAGALLTCCVFIWPGSRRKRCMGMFLSVLAVVFIGGLTACTSSHSSTGITSGSTPTPAGTYAVAITASSTGDDAAMTTLQLTVTP